MGFFEGLNVERYDRQYTDRQLMRRIGEYFRPQAGRLAVVMLLVIAIGVIFAAWPILVGRLVDMLASRPTGQLIALAGLALAVIGFLEWGLNWARRRLGKCLLSDSSSSWYMR